MYRTEWQPRRQWRNRPVTRELDERVTGWLVRTCMALVVAMAPTGLYLLSINASLDLNYRSAKLEKELDRMAMRERELRSQVAAIETPAALERWARGQGFEPPTTHGIAIWDPDRRDRELLARRDSTPSNLAAGQAAPAR